MGHQLIIAYLVLVNASAFILMLADKQKARRSVWRIPEGTLLGVAAIGGSLGAVIGMHLFRHKTRHLKFRLGLPLMLAVQICLLILLN